MGAIYSFIFDLITDPLGLPISPIWEYIILIVLNEIAYRIAWYASPGGRFGSEIHWAVRIPTFVIIWAITYAIIAIVKWIFANWIIILSILGAIIIISGVIAIIVLRRRRGKP